MFQLLVEYPRLAVAISICVSILIAVIGFVPSVFITAANIVFFGFWKGTLLSFLGESFGAGIAFVLYRKGFKKVMGQKLHQFQKIKMLLEAKDKQAFYLVFSLRFIPYVPSGLITFAAAIGRVSFPVFFAASSLGKLPSLLLEAYSVYGLTQFGWQAKLITVALCVTIAYYLFKQNKKNK